MYDNFSPKNSTLDNLLAGKQESPRQEKRKHRFHLGNGAALILVALMIISLLCFAALSIVSAKADSRLTDRYAAQITAYHTARNLGVEFLAETDAQLKQYLEDSADREAYLEKARSLPSCTDSSEENPVLVFSVPMTEHQTYCLVVRVLFPSSADAPRYEVLSSRTVTSTDVTYDTSLEVLGHD